jgi:hypothetical protein
MHRPLRPALRRTRIALAVVVVAGSVAGVASAGTVHFESPSHNINCFMLSTPTTSADCIVRTATWPNPPKKPSSCDLDWMAHEVGLYRQKVAVGGCRGDVGPLCYTGPGHCTVLGYGESVKVGTIRCSSASAGVTCRSTVGKRVGFLIARERYAVYR